MYGYNYNNQKDDIIELFIDCDQRMICLKNEQTHQVQQLNVNINTCSFPWQFFITLLYANDRVRLCKEKCPAKQLNEEINYHICLSYYFVRLILIECCSFFLLI
jgi:hypothetical protein